MRVIDLARFAVAAICVAGPVLAQDPPPFEDFTFKRVTVPGAGVGKRITVQIGPEETPAARPTLPDAPISQAPQVPASARYGWFWSVVEPGMDVDGAGRLQEAIKALGAPPAGQEVSTPRLDALRAIVDVHGSTLLAQSVQTRVSPAFALAVIAVESGGRVVVTSGAGAQGLMQLIPATAARFGVEDAFDPKQNIEGGMAYLAWLLDNFDGDPVLALAGYNAGENAVATHGGVPPYAETRDYVPKVLAAWLVARNLCATPPDLVTDGCVFALPG